MTIAKYSDAGKTVSSLILRPLSLLLSPVHFAEFPVPFPGFQTSNSSAGGVVLKIKMSKNHRRMAVLCEEPEKRYLPTARNFITDCLFNWDILERKKRSWSMYTSGPAAPCWSGLVFTSEFSDLLCDSEFYPLTLINNSESLAESLLLERCPVLLSRPPVTKKYFTVPDVLSQ